MCYARIEQGTISSKCFLLKKKTQNISTGNRTRDLKVIMLMLMFAYITLFLTYKRYHSQAYSSAY